MVSSSLLDVAHSYVVMATSMEFDQNLLKVSWVTLIFMGSWWILRQLHLQWKTNLLPPGPRPWPIVGNLPSLSKGGLPHQALLNLAKQYGGLTFLWLGSKPCIVVSSASMAKEIFQNHDAIFSSRPPGLVPEFLTNYKNIVHTPSGPYWRRLRRICSTYLLSHKRLVSYSETRTQEIHTMMKLLRGQWERGGGGTNLRMWLHSLTTNNMTNMVVNKRYFGDEAGHNNLSAARQFQQASETGINLVGAFIISDFIPYLKFLTKFQGWEAKLLLQRELTNNICSDMIQFDERRRRLKEKAGSNQDDRIHQDMVDVMLSAEVDGEEVFTDQDITWNVMDFLIAGSDTIATAVEWTMTELIRHPDVLGKAQEELDSVVDPSRVVQEADISKLPFLQAIVKESFRLHPPTPLSIPRASTEEVEVCGYKLPAGTRLILNILAIHRDPAVYDNPDEFVPNRFLQHREVTATTGNTFYELVPFGVGRRMCPGYALGNMMVHLILAHILHSFEWSMPSGEDPQQLDMSELFNATVSRKQPLHLVARPKRAAYLY